MIATVRRKGAPENRPEVIKFEEPGLKIQNKVKGKGHSKKAADAKEQLIERKVQKIFQEERKQGNAAPSNIIKEMELTSKLRNEVFELGVSNMEISKRGSVMAKWRKRQRAPHELLQKWQTESDKLKKKVTYPELMAQVAEEKEKRFEIIEKQYLGDDTIKDTIERRGKKRKMENVPPHVYNKHMYRGKYGKLMGSVLTVTKQEANDIRFKAKVTGFSKRK